MQAFGFYFFLPLIYLISFLPFRALYFLSDCFFYLNYYVIKYRKKVVWANLKSSFPEKSDIELKVIEKYFFRNLTDIMFETVKSFTISKNALCKRMTSVNLELMNDYLLKKNKSYIVTGGHCGNYEWVNLFMSLSFEHELRAVYRRLTHPYFETFFFKSRSKFGTKLYQMHESYTNPKLWEQNKLYAFALVNDQSPPPDKAYWTTFLNHDTGFFKGPEVFAKQHDLAVVYVTIRKPKRGHYELVYSLLSENPKEEPEGQILENHARLLEKDILENIPNWLWSHKRWKHKKPI